jgi:hypothetical protein
VDEDNIGAIHLYEFWALSPVRKRARSI